VEVTGIQVNIAAKDDHVPGIKRKNRVIKEKACTTIQTLPYTKILEKMKIAMMQYITCWLNNVPKKDQDNSPKDTIMDDQKLDFKAICHLPLGPMSKCIMIYK
jgi:hypothetical protein